MATGDDPTGLDWSDREIDLIVADYFDMLRMERAGEPYVKAERNRALQELTHRSRGSIEFKHQNISAILLKLGMDWIAGYKPAVNYQKALINGIERYLDNRNEILVPPSPEIIPGIAEDHSLFLEPPPHLTETQSEPEPLKRLVRKFDPAARDSQNRKLGKLGEERAFFSERTRLKVEGRADLAGKVRWISEEEGDGAGYDILSFDAKGAERLLEVKTTVGSDTTPFFLTENERLLSTERPNEFRLLRLYDFNRKPRAFELVPPLEHSVILRPAIYRAGFDS
jgi:Protein NO VEIN, C-terminal